MISRHGMFGTMLIPIKRNAWCFFPTSRLAAVRTSRTTSTAVAAPPRLVRAPRMNPNKMNREAYHVPRRELFRSVFHSRMRLFMLVPRRTDSLRFAPTASIAYYGDFFVPSPASLGMPFQESYESSPAAQDLQQSRLPAPPSGAMHGFHQYQVRASVRCPAPFDLILARPILPLVQC